MATYSAAHNIAVNYRAALQFVFAGKAVFTVVNDDTGVRFTYRVQVCKDNPNLHFVSVLSGPDNTRDYSYLGTVWKGQSYKHGRKSRVGADAQSAKVFTWILRRLVANQLPQQVRVHHEGRCCQCGRRLTTPESIASGIGPVCANR
mgnify:FL=1